MHSFYWSVGIGAPPPCHGHRACHGHLTPSPLSWPPSQWLCDAARTATQPSLPAVQPSQHMHCKKSAVGLHGLLLQRMWASSRRVSDALGALSRQISLSQDHRHPSQDHSTGGGAPQDQAPTAGSVRISRPGGGALRIIGLRGVLSRSQGCKGGTRDQSAKIGAIQISGRKWAQYRSRAPERVQYRS